MLSLIMISPYNKQSTYIHPATGSMSSIDLALCSPAVALNYHWQPKNDTFGSDHFPIIISSTKTSSPVSTIEK